MSVIEKFDGKTHIRDFQDGLALTPVLEGACERIRMFRGTLEAMKTWEPELNVYGEEVQIFLFLNGSGYITTPVEAFNIREPAIYVTNFERDRFQIHAGRENLEFVRILGTMNQEDCRQIGKSHMIFPRFRPLSRAWEHTMSSISDEDSNVRGYVLIENRKLGCYNMGWLTGPGKAHIGEQAEPAYDRWCIAMEGADYIHQWEGREIPMKSGDILFVPRGAALSAASRELGNIDYVWFHLNRAYD